MEFDQCLISKNKIKRCTSATAGRGFNHSALRGSRLIGTGCPDVRCSICDSVAALTANSRQRDQSGKKRLQGRKNYLCANACMCHRQCDSSDPSLSLSVPLNVWICIGSTKRTQYLKETIRRCPSKSNIGRIAERIHRQKYQFCLKIEWIGCFLKKIMAISGKSTTNAVSRNRVASRFEFFGYPKSRGIPEDHVRKISPPPPRSMLLWL